MEPLIKQAKKGDTNAINTLISNHRDLAFSIALNITKNKADAEDIVQNSFLIVLKSLQSFRNESKFSTWLFKIVYRESIRAFKQKRKLIEFSKTDIESEETDVKKEINITKLLSNLNEKEYIVISLFYLKEKSINDIIKITSFSKANIKVLLHRGRQKLKKIKLDTSYYHGQENN
ncbi:hypothetical protein DIS18_00570 [Algibacter marinivivus]|uniref:RNA polymerase sigma factor n=1 Tax=Algibacter marinivivus TaxID=2100723 RepID=A0A2U2X5Q2_9FLAO|nr:sigma-70 family RNA polymerase sigma factor [Algibacter marinivivus]PWH83082.1 hypothetical protein DIS18_00570 [Algibacter marinivivus]